MLFSLYRHSINGIKDNYSCQVKKISILLAISNFSVINNSHLKGRLYEVDKQIDKDLPSADLLSKCPGTGNTI